MAIAVSGSGGVLVRADPEHGDRLVQTTEAEPAVMRGRPMTGWLRVAPEHLRTKAQLRTWVRVGTAHARSLPAKPTSSPAKTPARSRARRGST